jgi:hypothetical protein
MSAPKIHSGSLVCSTGNLPFARLHDDLLAIDQRGGYCYSMNPSAARIWELIPTPTSVSAVCETLCREFGVDQEQCRQDVVDFLSVLTEAGLVEVAG